MCWVRELCTREPEVVTSTPFPACGWMVRGKEAAVAWVGFPLSLHWLSLQSTGTSHGAVRRLLTVSLKLDGGRGIDRVKEAETQSHGEGEPQNADCEVRP